VALSEEPGTVRGPDADRRCRHQCRDPAGRPRPRAGLFLAHRPGLRGRADLRGQRAAPGAIERVEIDPETKEPRFRVIGCDKWSDEDGFAEATAATGITGICGSGIIEAVAEMRIAGLIDEDGLIGSAAQTGTARSVPEGRTHAYLIHDATARAGRASPSPRATSAPSSWPRPRSTPARGC
jgi:hypothetical protein